MKRKLIFFFLLSSRAELLAKQSALRSKLKIPNRVTNQKLKRKQTQLDMKDRKIRELQRKLNEHALASELKDTKAELKKKKKHTMNSKSRTARRSRKLCLFFST